VVSRINPAKWRAGASAMDGAALTSAAPWLDWRRSGEHRAAPTPLAVLTLLAQLTGFSPRSGREELKMLHETRKSSGLPGLRLVRTLRSVPVLRAHSDR